MKQTTTTQMSNSKDKICSLVPLSQVVGAAAIDLSEDFSSFERRGTHWAVRGLKKLTRETLKSGRRRVLLTVNKNFNSVFYPADVKDILFVGYINDKNEKVPFRVNNRIVDVQNLETIPCEIECEAKCDCCFPKQICSDLTKTQEIKLIDINGTDYEQTITSTLMPTGEYYVQKSTPYWDNVTSTIAYLETKEYTTFDVADCGCIKATEENTEKLKCYCYDEYCMYCSPCSCDFAGGGYKIFEDKGIIQFHIDMTIEKVYIEYRGILPKVNGQYMIPEVTLETIINYIKFKHGENNKSKPKWEREWLLDQYRRERDNMNKVVNKVSLTHIIQSFLSVPQFNYI